MDRIDAEKALFQKNGRQRKTHTKWDSTRAKCGMSIRKTTLIVERDATCMSCQTMAGPEPPRSGRRPERRRRIEDVRRAKFSECDQHRIEQLTEELASMTNLVSPNCVDYRALMTGIAYLANIGVH